MSNLVEAGILDRVDRPGPDIFAIAEQTDEIVNRRLEEEAQRNLEALIQQLDDELQAVEVDTAAEGGTMDDPGSPASVARADGAGRTVRSILATAFGVDPEHVVEYLRSGDPIDRLNSAVDAIETSEEVETSREYGQILFLRAANRYRLTSKAIQLL